MNDIRNVFVGEDLTRLTTAELLAHLNAIDESPWGDYRGKELDARRLARLLKPYSIGPKTIRQGVTTHKGYLQEDLADAWSRYLPAMPDTGNSRNSRNPERDGVTDVTELSSSARSRAGRVAQPDPVDDRGDGITSSQIEPMQDQTFNERNCHV